jgi:hypothetical protein
MLEVGAWLLLIGQIAKIELQRGCTASHIFFSFWEPYMNNLIKASEDVWKRVFFIKKV